ncbi:ABC transporter ATP-binding protein [Cyanobium sp. T1B-Tous]|jgi:branched-chain amino acid transport system ATP-binding protein|uniref:ABC transporter ATP-binding protein n=1 Tax=Cyanobium sp. T1B-Tous TaxID=2823721 RepID=UPI0020CDE325|nr:ABC transporter ATP-binding protein [Cyanobium sp. T1B-Tous]MCP9806675.1 ABC transporter ATP-binding protein [Cyanobium sp. T1B-Tous]
MSAPLLELRHLVVRYGSITALHGIDLTVQTGELVTLLGANGAGKSTTLRAISRLIPASEGEILWHGGSILRLRTERTVKLGISHCPEGRRVLSRQSVADNLALGAWLRRDRANITADLDHCYALFPRLAERRQQLAGSLSGGEQQMLAIARSLMARPTLLMLDEPSLGLAPKLVGEVMAALAQLHRDGLTILLVEQNAQAALAIADRGYVLEAGQLTLQGPAAQLLADPSLRAAYLGG